MMTILKRLQTVNKVVYSLIFEDLQEVNLRGDFKFVVELGVIFALEVEQVDGMIKTVIEESLGLRGDIISKKIIVK